MAALRDHNYCTTSLERSTLEGLGHTEQAPCVSTMQTAAKSSDKRVQPDNMDIIFTRQTQTVNPISFLPLTVQQRNVICAKLGLSVENQPPVSYEFTGVGLLCSSAPSRQVRVYGDGNCLFRAFSFLLLGTEMKHDTIRAQVCDYITDDSNWTKLHSYIREYNSGEAYIASTKMNLFGTWGTAVELVAFAQLTGKDVVVYTVNRWLRYCCSGTMKHTTKHALYLDNSSGMHYNPVFGVSHMTEEMIAFTHKQFHPTKADDIMQATSNSIQFQMSRPTTEVELDVVQRLQSDEEIVFRAKRSHMQREYRKTIRQQETQQEFILRKQKIALKQKQYRKAKREHETVEQSILRKKQDAVRKRKYREEKRLRETPEQRVLFQQQNAEKQRKYRQAKRRQETVEQKQHVAKRQQKYLNAIKQCETDSLRLSESEVSSKNYGKTKKQHTNIFIARKSLSNFNECNVASHNVGGMTFKCSACNGMMFKKERSKGSLQNDEAAATFSLCCSYGAVKLPPIRDPPSILKQLLTGSTKRDHHFRDNIRAYNSSLAFASLCLTGEEYHFKSKGPYCFRISGQVYHLLGHMEPETGKTPSFSQLYIYDQQNELQNRLNIFTNLDKTLLQELQNMMKEVNPFVQKYKHAADVIQQESIENVRLVLKSSSETIDPRRYNLPTGTDVAVILPTDSHYMLSQRDFVVYKNASQHPEKQAVMKMDGKHPMYDPLMYVLTFPYGDKGWELGGYTMTSRKKLNCTPLQYYKYRLIPRAGDTFNTIHRMGRLFQQYVVDMYAKIEHLRLQYIRHNQSKLRADVYQGVADAVSHTDGMVDGSQIGKRVILPSSFTGSPRQQHQLYQDAMAIVRHFGKPDLFITFTCNPQWKEITDELLPHQTSADRFDIVARVFKQKLQCLLQDLYYAPTPVLGKMVAMIHVIEWQKRGPPHAHILAICDKETKPRTPEDYDEIVSAEIPDKEQFPVLHQIVTKSMMHGPCGPCNPNSPCMQDAKCTKKFPKDFTDRTFDGDGYPQYRRRDDGRFVEKNGISLNNQWVVPYNPYLIMKYKAHINVEICSSIKSCKYLYKYVYKGPDMASVALTKENNKSQENDEIDRYVNSRFVTASEACWRIFDFDIHGREPSVQRLAVHEENAQVITFQEGNVADALLNAKNTTLLGWFELNKSDTAARKFKYHEIPEHYVWNTRSYKWTPRKQGYCIGRMYTTNPAQGERHYLRMLLHHIPGAISFADLKSSPDGVIHKTFKDTALALGLLDTDDEWDKCLIEAASFCMPYQLRSLFVTILVYGEPGKAQHLWTKHKDVMGEDLLRRFSVWKHISPEDLKIHVDNEVLLLLQEELEGMDRSLERYDLPTPKRESTMRNIPQIIADEMYNIEDQNEIAETKYKSLNVDQKHAFHAILKAIQDENHKHQLFFLNAPGGHGKTFLIETLLSTVRGMGKIALAVASSGIAAELVEGGRTAHSRFKIPIPIHETSVCNITKQSNESKLMKKTAAIIWDEIMMSHVDQVNCVDQSLRDILDIDRPFGGIPVVFSGDPRQILPVVRHGDRARIIKACIHTSPLWSQVQQLNLNSNLRVAPEETEFASYLLRIGNGTETEYPEVDENTIKLHAEHLVQSLEELIDRVFPDIEEGYLDKYWVARRAILTPKNDNVDRINETVMERFPGISETYLSADSIAEEDLVNAYPIDFLNSITLSGMPPHSMTLKVGAPVMLLRNLRAGPGSGLRNGTRLIITKLGEKVLEAEIASGVNKGKRVLLPRITLMPSDTELPFTLKRRQFPIRPCFAMSINKAQGQTLDSVGVYLPENVFTHGQLYVAFSRVRKHSGLAVFVNNSEGFTKNIVYKEVL